MISRMTDVLYNASQIAKSYIYSNPSPLFNTTKHVLLTKAKKGDVEAAIELARRHLNKSTIAIEDLSWALHIYFLNQENALNYSIKNNLIKTYPDLLDHVSEIKKILTSDSFDKTHRTLECYAWIYDMYHTFYQIANKQSKIEDDLRKHFINFLLTMLKQDHDSFQFPEIHHPSEYEFAKPSREGELLSYCKDSIKYQLGSYHSFIQSINEKCLAFIHASLGDKKILHDAALILTSYIIEDANLPRTYAHALAHYSSIEYKKLLELFNAEMQKVYRPTSTP